MPFCHLAHRDLFYVERGQGEPLVFLNGLAGDCLSWMGQLKVFARQYRCLAVDSRDAGQSAYVTEPYTIPDLAADLAEFLQSLKLFPAHAVGLSMGGMIAQELALSAPALVKSLVLVNTLARVDDWFRGTLNAFELIRRHVPDTAAFFETILPWWVSNQFFAQSGRTSWLCWLLKQNPHAQRLEGFLRQIEAVRRHDTLGRLPRIQCPVLIISGADDQIIPPRYAEELRRRMPHAQHVVVPGVGHALPIENPGQFSSLLARFLQELRTPRRSSA